jgi:diadenosine tetraphosphate (Ap4A) HIT family hydrolase
MNNNKCCLCSQIAGEVDNDLFAKMIPSSSYIRRIPMETEDFAVIPSLGPVAPGHVLICPKQHYKSFANISDDLEPQYNLIKVRLKRVLKNIYNKPVHCFEHGTARRANQPLCTVEHAHLHLIPTSVAAYSILEEVKDWRDLGNKFADLKGIVGDSEYLYYESPDGFRKIITAETGTFESQYMRKIFSEALGNDTNWNWRQNPLPFAAHETFEIIANEAMATP